MANRYRFMANVPRLKGAEAEQVGTVVAGNWAAALGMAAREIKRRPALHKRRVDSISIMLTLVGKEPKGGQPAAPAQAQEQMPLAVPAEDQAEPVNEQALASAVPAVPAAEPSGE